MATHRIDCLKQMTHLKTIDVAAMPDEVRAMLCGPDPPPPTATSSTHSYSGPTAEPDLSFIGELLDDALACAIADGLVCPVTHAPFNFPDMIERPLAGAGAGAAAGSGSGTKRASISSSSSSFHSRSSSSSSSSSSATKKSNMGGECGAVQCGGGGGYLLCGPLQ